MNSVALGWVHRDTALPGPMQGLGQGAVQTIAAPASRCGTARDRLALLQACYDCGIDLLPLSCDHVWQINPAMDLARQCTENILAQLATIRGTGQLSITLSWSGGLLPSDRCATGRAWLQAQHLRQTILKKQSCFGQQVMDIVTLGLPGKRRVFDNATSRRLDLWIQRQDLAGAQAQIVEAAQHLAQSPLPDLSLMITGLWPVYGFVTSPQPCMTAPA